MRCCFGVAALAVALLSASLPNTNAEHWAVIVAGSRGYWNYRHQADACHAYHVVRRHGIPEENVVLMMYDDVANSDENPFKGQLFNKPANASSGEGPLEVYAGCKVDYRGNDVTPENFLSVLLGDFNATNGKKVLASGPDDRVFVNFVDHGAPGVIVFPHDELLTSSRLMGTLEKMYEQKRYKELVLYIEACESGSMFEDAAMAKINAFATTAANATESSWGYYCPPMDIIDGQPMNTCLGDLYSINWMQDSDRTDLSGETLRNQYHIVKTQTNMSNVLAFGAKHIRHEIVGNFQSNYDHAPSNDGSTESSEDEITVGETQQDARGVKRPMEGAVNAHDVNVVLAFYKYLRSTRGQDRELFANELIREIESRERSDRLFERIRDGVMKASHRTQGSPPISSTNKKKVTVACREAMFKTFQVECGDRRDEEIGIGHGFTSYSLQYAQDLGKMCDAFGDIATVASILRETCQEKNKNEHKSYENNGNRDVVYDASIAALA